MKSQIQLPGEGFCCILTYGKVFTPALAMVGIRARSRFESQTTSRHFARYRPVFRAAFGQTERNDAMSETSDTKTGSTVPVIDASLFFTGNRAVMSTMSQFGADAMRHALSMNRQFLDFIQTRIEEEQRLGDALAACKTPQEATECLGAFYKTAFDQYSDEMRVLSEETVDAASDVMKTADAKATAA